MTRVVRPALFLRAALLAACVGLAPPSALAGNACLIAGGGTGGTGSPLEEGGMGGTGHVPEEGGMGGTGVTAGAGGVGGTGIVGVITGFASICVGGLEVHFHDGTAVTRNGSPASLRDLAIGQVVSIEAQPGKAGLTAQRVAVVDAVVGPVSKANGDVIELLGQRVRVTSETVRQDGGSTPRVGEMLRVSGERTRDGTVVATRIERAQGVPASVAGVVERASPGSFHVAGLRVETPSSGTIISSGKEVLAVGRWDGSRLVASSLKVDPVQGFSPRVDRVVLEGFVADVSKAGRMNLGGREVLVSSGTQFSGGDKTTLARDQRVRISARISTDGAIRADRVQYRRDLLPSGERGLRSTPEPARGGDSGGGKADGDSGGRSGERDQRSGSRDDSGGGSDRPRNDTSGSDGRGDRRDDGRGGTSSGGGSDHAGGRRADEIRTDRSSRSDRPVRTERIERGRDH